MDTNPQFDSSEGGWSEVKMEVEEKLEPKVSDEIYSYGYVHYLSINFLFVRLMIFTKKRSPWPPPVS